MQSPDKRPALVILTGPTAVGKTELAIRLAGRIAGEILSADSRLFYRGMDIGTAKPTAAELATVPHHLIDFLDPDEAFSLADFQETVIRIEGEIRVRGRIPMLVGGTGQYIRAIVEGWRIPNQPADERLRAGLAALEASGGPGTVHRWLSALDPAAAGRIDPRNVRRTVRALEVVLQTGARFSKQRRRAEPHFRTIQIGLIRPREDLYDRIDLRIEAMLAAGLVAEVAGLLAAGFSPDLPSMSAIGYHEACRFIAGEISREEMVTAMRKRSRTLVRRQTNWFKPDDPRIRWVDVDENSLERSEEIIREFLGRGRIV